MWLELCHLLGWKENVQVVSKIHKQLQLVKPLDFSKKQKTNQTRNFAKKLGVSQKCLVDRHFLQRNKMKKKVWIKMKFNTFSFVFQRLAKKNTSHRNSPQVKASCLNLWKDKKIFLFFLSKTDKVKRHLNIFRYQLQIACFFLNLDKMSSNS